MTPGSSPICPRSRRPARLSESSIVILPLGAVEHHGPHLPMSTDLVMVDEIAGAVVDEYGDELDLWLLPALPFTKSNEHAWAAGTVWLSPETLLAVLRDIGRSLATLPARRLVFLNGHGGNTSLLDVACRELRIEHDLLTFLLHPSLPADHGGDHGADDPDAGFGIHGGASETSMLLYLRPDLVDPYHGWQFGTDGPAVHIPQLEDGVPIPPKATLQTAHCTVRYGVVWVALDDPVGGLPEVDVSGDPTYRFVRQFDEVWSAAAPRLVDNSFDPAHVAYVHQDTFGTPERARIPVPEIVFTDEGLVMRTALEVENHLELSKRTNLIDDESTVRMTESRLVAPFLRVMSITYPTGLHHVLVTGIAPVDDTHLRLVQWAWRNDTEVEVTADDVVAFDRAVTLEDKWLLEQTKPDYELTLNQLAHIKVDRGTIAVRKLYRSIVDGTWPALDTGAAADDPRRRGSTRRMSSGSLPTTVTVPVVDVSPFGSASTPDRQRVAAEVASGFEEIGFLVVAGHGVPDEVIDGIYAAGRAFFELPLDQKRAVRSPVHNLYQGYAHPGPNPGDHTSERQSYNVFRFDTIAEAVAHGYPEDLDGLFFEALWPREPAGFRAAVRAYYAHMELLVERLLEMVELGLGTAPGSLTSMLEHHLSTQVINYYSDDIDSGHEPSPYRFKAHHDGSLITVLSQNDGPGPLQLYHREAGWLDVAAVDDTFIVNAGEILTRLTNGRFPATPHRVLQPPADAPKTARMSTPFFFKPGLDARIAPLPELITDPESSRFEPHTGRSWYLRNQANIDNGYDSTKQYEDLASAGDVPA